VRQSFHKAVQCIGVGRWKNDPRIRFHLRKFSDEPYRPVIDVFTGQQHHLDGVRLDSLEADEADYVVDLLNLHDMQIRGHPIFFPG
jgi:hypothetical protein